MDIDLLSKTFRNTLGAAVYIFIVSQIMQNGSKIFGEQDNMFTPFAVLLLFTLSAAVVGGLVLGQSVWLFVNNKKAESIKAAIYSVAWLGVYTLLILLVMFLIK